MIRYASLEGILLISFRMIAIWLLVMSGGCSKSEARVRAAIEATMTETLSISSYGDAEIIVQGTDISLDAAEEGEAGIGLELIDEHADDVVISYLTVANQPATLRLKRDGNFTYQSANSQGQIVLGKNGFDAALIYFQGPVDAVLRISGIGSCEDARYVCLGSGEIAFTPTSGTAAGSVLFQPLGATEAWEEESGFLAFKPGIASTEYGAEFFLRPELSTEKFILEFEVPSNETALLRSNRNASERYYPANRGWARLWDDARLVIYDSVDGGFEIANFNLVSCTTDDWRCNSRKQFQSLLPDRSNMPDLGYAINLLNWATQHADYAMSPKVTSLFDTERLQAWEIYFRYFQTNSGGGYCGGTADFFTKLLQEQGLDAFTWNFGTLEDDLTHVTTILHAQGRFFMLDATFGTYFVDPETGTALDVFELLSGRPFSTIEEPARERDFLYARSDLGRIAFYKARGLIRDCKYTDGANTVHCHYPTFGLQQYLNVTYPKLSANGYSNEPSALIDMMKAGTFGIGNMTDTDSMMLFATKLSEAGVPLIDRDGSLPPTRLLDDKPSPLSP